MKNLSFKLFLFLFPFIICLGVELFVLPIDFFTFRVWEAVVIRNVRSFFPGRFYPNMEIMKVEEGDLAAHTPFALKKNVRWTTDQYGYRKRNTNLQKHKILIIGESNIAGSGLTQEEILSEVLETRLRVSVYPYAPIGRITSFLKDIRFIENPPEIVVFARIERELLDLDLLKPVGKKRWPLRIKQQIQLNPMIQTFGIYLDRLVKLNMLHSVRAGVKRIVSSPRPLGSGPYPSPFGPVFFIQGKSANEEISQETLDKTIQTIKQYHHTIQQRGMRFIFLPIPNKENIFYESLQTPKPAFLKRLIEELKREGVETIDTQKAFEEIYEKEGTLLYQTDDTHWNADGVALTATLIQEAIGKIK